MTKARRRVLEFDSLIREAALNIRPGAEDCATHRPIRFNIFISVSIPYSTFLARSAVSTDGTVKFSHLVHRRGHSPSGGPQRKEEQPRIRDLYRPRLSRKLARQYIYPPTTWPGDTKAHKVTKRD